LEGIEYARKHPVDMVPHRLQDAEPDGIEVIRRLRRIFGYEDVPIVCITVVNDREVRYRALEPGYRLPEFARSTGSNAARGCRIS